MAVDPLLRLDDPRGVDERARVRAAELPERAHAAPEPVLEQPGGRADPRDVGCERLERSRRRRSWRSGRGSSSFSSFSSCSSSFLGFGCSGRGPRERSRRGGCGPFEARDALVGLCKTYRRRQRRKRSVERGRRGSRSGGSSSSVADAKHRLRPRRLLGQRRDGPSAAKGFPRGCVRRGKRRDRLGPLHQRARLDANFVDRLGRRKK